MPVKVFISYRRADSPYAAAQIYDRLSARFGEDAVFFDVDAIPLSVDFREHVNVAIEQSDVFLAIIGDRWLEAGPDGQSRLASEDDLVRIELESANEHDLAIVPVLVGTAAMPAPGELPESLRFLSYRNAAEVRPGTSLSSHLERLIAGVESLGAQAAAARAEAEAERARAESERRAAAARAAAEAAEAEALEAQKKAEAARAKAAAADSVAARRGSTAEDALADTRSPAADAQHVESPLTVSPDAIADAPGRADDVAVTGRAADAGVARSGSGAALVICCLAGWAMATLRMLLWQSYAYFDFGGAISMLGLLTGFGTLAGLVLIAPLGDRMGRRRLILIGLVLMLVSCVLAAIVYVNGGGLIEVFYAAQVTLGLAYGVLLPNAIALIADLYPPAKSGRAIAVLLVVTVLVSQVPWVDWTSSMFGFEILVIAAAVLALLLLAWAVMKISDGDFERAETFGGSFRAVFQRPHRRLFMLTALAYAMAVAAAELSRFLYWTPLRPWIGVVGGLAMIWVAGHARARRSFMVFCGLGVFAVALGAAVGFALWEAPGLFMWFFLAAAGIGVLAVNTPSLPESSRATAVGLVMSVAWLVSWLVAVAIPREGSPIVTLTLSAVAMLAVIGALKGSDQRISYRSRVPKA